MAEKPEDRLHMAIDGLLHRMELGATTKARISRAIAELVRRGSDGQQLALMEAKRVAEAGQQGTLPNDVVLEVMGLLTSGWGNAARNPTTRTTTRVGRVSRSTSRKSLFDVPDGTQVEYDGIVAVVERGKIRLPDGQVFDTPTPAALWVTNQESVNGWKAWRLSDGRPLEAAVRAR